MLPIEETISIGVVIPVVMAEFLDTCLKSISLATSFTNLRFCVVNDGNNSIHKELERLIEPYKWVEIIHLDNNHMFAGANNAGWRHLIDEYPHLIYLGSLNSDTLVRQGWLEAMVRTLEDQPDVAMVAPVMETRERWLGIFNRRKTYATWRLGNWETPMIPDRSDISMDTESEVLGGFCFLAKKQALTEVGMFSEEYMNSCEDVDLSLKLKTAGYRLFVSSRSCVFHYSAAFRYRPGTRTDLDRSHQILREKWLL